MDLDHTSSSVMFTYNLGRKCVGEIIPTPVNPQKRGIIGVIDGCMSVVCEDCSREIYEVWVMKEYGIKESWTKLMNIPEPPGDSIRNLVLDGVSDYGDILFRSWTQRDNHNVVIYNVAENKYTKNLVSGGNYYIRMYVETLVSPGLGLKRTTIAAIEG
ncbi:PREDICTED: F-box/kelch-repeat protein At3g23880-like [Erythranthe guttata]|uniref:F-box/kelch-repeat protein At3g23880-like n=1 Tax=Erythranthe guttata TaxID=4155 RepID=UPI00064DDE0C|nr:PREDICTED: F-box/kelch-repeat protein At3g23880-like [Erythranthe guttata]|eukprot:XP_012844500.1 PREDICTED: F-box/kelch-repeat protein At3g23880-like [Erythranthe guttata]